PARSRTAAYPALSNVDASVTTTAASSLLAPADTASATASCSAVSDSDGSATLAPTYVRPSPSRTAAPSIAPTRARAERARTTSLASSGSRATSAGTPSRLLDAVESDIGQQPLLVRFGDLGAGAAHQHGVAAVAPAGRPLGRQLPPP